MVIDWYKIMRLAALALATKGAGKETRPEYIIDRATKFEDWLTR